jgi:Zn-dependent peptidase ImmA (M78 family)
LFIWLDKYIDGIIDLYGTNDIHEIYDCLGIIIKRLDPSNLLLHGHEGFYYRDLNDLEVVFLENDLNIEFERFVLAHELCHALVHTNIDTKAFTNSLINSDKLELQANYFAIKLLNINISDYKDFTLEQVASTLNLPYKCLYFFSYISNVCSH